MDLSVKIIGSGIAGLASAVRMASKGHRVTVFEQAAEPGGKMGEIRWKDFRWDAGPSLFTLPDLMEELYVIADEEMKLSVRYRQLETITRYFYDTGLVINAYGDPREFAREVEMKTGESQKRVLKFLNRARKIYELTRDVFIFGVFNSVSTFVSPQFLKAALQIYRLEAFSTMHRANRRKFSSDQLVQLFDRYATYNGSNPYRAPGTLNVISHLEHNMGAYFPEKGMRVLATELYNLARKLGVEFQFDSRVDRILMEHGSVKGLRVNGVDQPADLVISDVDIYYVYKDLLPDQPFPKKYFKGERSTSAMIFYWALDQSFQELELHNILFSSDYRKEFDSLFEDQQVPDDPTVYIFISSKMVPGDAPEGKENWFVMINVPPDTGQDWDRETERARGLILNRISKVLGISVEEHILHETIRDPRNIEKETFSYQGSLYGSSSNHTMAAFNRHPNHRHNMKGLYFVGGSVHPGGGIPLCLASAKIVEKQIIKHYYR